MSDPRYWSLIGMFVWNIGMLIWNYFEPKPIFLLAIMMFLPTILIFGIFIESDNQRQRKLGKDLGKKR